MTLHNHKYSEKGEKYCFKCTNACDSSLISLPLIFLKNCLILLPAS